MAIDFAIPEDAKAVRGRVCKWVDEHRIPPEKQLEGRSYKEVLGELRVRAREEGLWCPFVPTEWGGMGLGPLADALVQMELGRSGRACHEPRHLRQESAPMPGSMDDRRLRQPDLYRSADAAPHRLQGRAADGFPAGEFHRQGLSRRHGAF